MKSLILAIALLSSAVAVAGDKVGNGGGLWACVNPSQTVVQGMLVDLYEARMEFGWEPIVSTETNPLNIVKERETYVRGISQYGIQLSLALAQTLNKMRLVDAVLEKVDDSLFRMRPTPASCSGTWEYLQFANFTHLNQVLVRQDLWNNPAIPTLDKAALLWHETIYKWLRETYGDTDSVRTRQIVGLLFSRIDANDFDAKVAEVLRQGTGAPPPPPPPNKTVYVCEIKNDVTWLWYSGHGGSQVAAKQDALVTCQEQVQGFHCNEFRMRCDSYSENAEPAISCTVVGFGGRMFRGIGRSPIEAGLKAREACQIQPNGGVHCQEPVCN